MWIKVSDELPPIGKKVKLCINGVELPGIFIHDAGDLGDYDTEHFWDNGSLDEGITIEEDHLWQYYSDFVDVNK